MSHHIYPLNSKGKPCELGPIHEIHARLWDDGLHVPEYRLRTWVKEGLIPSIPTGRRVLIYYSKTYEILSGANPVLLEQLLAKPDDTMKEAN